MTLHELVPMIGDGFFLLMVAGIPLYAALRGVKVYDTFLDGAQHGIQVILAILPYMTALLVAIGMFRASGGFDVLAKLMQPILNLLHIDADLVPLALVRPFSGAATNGVFADILRTHGPDSLVARTAGTMMGSTETTFYVVALYFGAVGIQRTRHAVPAGLLADLVGIVASVVVCRWLLL